METTKYNILAYIGIGTFLLIGVIIAIGYIQGDGTSLTTDVNSSKVITNDTPIYLKEDFNTKYGVISIADKSSNKLVEYSLIKNTEQCWTECEAEGKAVLYLEGKLFDGKNFVGVEKLTNSQYWIKGIGDVEVSVPTYKEVCLKNNDSKNLTDVCFNEIVDYKTEIQKGEVWKEYNYEILPAGNYKWKLNGTKEGSANIDWQIISNGNTLNHWAAWNGTGGTISYDGAYTVLTFTTNGTFVWTGDANNVSVLVVGGGGGGGRENFQTGTGGGGGAGGLLYNSTYFVTAQSYSIVVGTYGNGYTGAASQGFDGQNSSFGTITARGGGGGGGGTSNPASGRDGGSGGGEANLNVATVPGTGIAGQGHDGGGAAEGPESGGGGGGASGDGIVKYGGNGTQYSINGTNIYYSGGGGGCDSAVNPEGGLGGGGRGALYNSANHCTNGTNGLGGGGGGSANYLATNPCRGGSGVVVIRYLTYIAPPAVNCSFSGYVKDSNGVGLNGANVTIYNQETGAYYNKTTSSATGFWSLNVTNGTTIYKVTAEFNSSLVGIEKQNIVGTC